jgi:hypothetical protein
VKAGECARAAAPNDSLSLEGSRDSTDASKMNGLLTARAVSKLGVVEQC